MDNELSRRKLVALGTAGGAAALLGAATVTPAHAGLPILDPASLSGPAGDPGGPRIGSAPIGGYSYVHCSSMDFYPLDLGTRSLSNGGAYGGRMVTTVELPPGAVLRDVEWYYAGSLTSSVNAYLWTSGSDGFVPVASASLGPSSSLAAHRTVVPPAGGGPYRIGTKLLCIADTNSNWVINGARIGLTSAPAGSVMLPSPVRVYDSRSGAKIGNGQTRIHSLASRIPAGALAAILNVSVTAGEKSGGLAVYNTGASLPSGSALYFSGGSIVSNELHTKLPSDRKVKVTMRGVTGSKAHYFIDLVGYTTT